MRYRQAAQTFGRDLTQAQDNRCPSPICCARQSTKFLYPFQLHVFLYDLHTDQYTAAPDENGHPNQQP